MKTWRTRSRWRRFMIRSQSRHSARTVRTKTLSDRVRLRRSHRRLDYPDAFACNDGVEVAGELAVAVADQEAKRRSPLVQCPRELAGLLGGPGAGRVRGAASQVDASATEFDEEEH